MKNIFTIAIVLVFAIPSMGQQEAQYTNFMYNQQLFNPAYVGSRNTASFTGLHRNQWLGFDGAPTSSLLSFQTPIMKKRAGVGGTISRYEIGISYAWYGSAAYSYNLRITQELDLRLGMHASLHYRGYEFGSEKVVTVSQNDPSLGDGGFQSRYNANVGMGMYLTYKDMFYFGASAPQLYPSDLSFNDVSMNTAEFSPHRYFTLGAAIPVTNELELMPNMLMKWVDHAPLDLDVNFSLRYLKKFTGGLTYRAGGNKSGESIDLLMFFQFGPKIGAGISYDMTLSDIRNYQSGSMELLVRYDLRDEKGNLENPRYFKKK